MNFLETPFLFPMVGAAIGVPYMLFAITRKWARAEETVFTGAIALGGVAVALGLASLDPANPGEALPKVILHLRDAVIVNVIGMAIKIVISKASASNIPASSGLEVNFEPLLLQMAENEKAAAVRAKDLSDALKAGQHEMKQSFTQLNTTLGGVLSELSKGATKEIITALEKVIERFNQNLTEQFGENFKRLNEACLKLVTWQEQYKEELSRLQTTNSAITENLTKSANALELSAQKTGSFTESAKQLENLYGNLTKHTEAMGAMLEQLRDVPKEAARSIEQLARIVKDSQEALEQHNRSMEDKIADFADNLAHEITEGEKQITAVVKDSQKALEQHNRDMEDKIAEFADSLVHEITEGEQQIASTIKESGEQFAKQIKETGSEMVELAKKTTEKVQADLAATVKDIGQNLKNSVSTIEGHNQKVQAALTTTVKEIGQSLKNSVSTIEDQTEKVQTALATSVEDIGQSLKDSVSAIEDHTQQVQTDLATLAEDIGQSLRDSVAAIEDHVIQTQEAVHGNLNEALAKFAQIINDALIHSLQNAISASNEAKNAKARVDSMERRYGGKH